MTIMVNKINCTTWDLFSAKFAFFFFSFIVLALRPGMKIFGMFVKQGKQGMFKGMKMLNLCLQILVEIEVRVIWTGHLSK